MQHGDRALLERPVVGCSEYGCQVYNDIQSCVKWRRHARECVGEETCCRLMGDGA